MDLKTIDKNIKIIRHKFHHRETWKESYLCLTYLNKLQRKRFDLCGAFLPNKNGKVYTYIEDADLWLNW